MSSVQVAPPCSCLSARRRSFGEQGRTPRLGARQAFSLQLSRFSLAKISDLAEVLPPPSSDELSARQARTQARELDTEKRIRFLCLAGGT